MSRRVCADCGVRITDGNWGGTLMTDRGGWLADLCVEHVDSSLLTKDAIDVREHQRRRGWR